MTSALAILERSFRRIEIPRITPRKRPLLCGVYMLTRQTVIVYVGSSVDVVNRLWTHVMDTRSTRSRVNKKQFDGAIWYPLPRAVLALYEGAFIRFLNPDHNIGRPPTGGEYDVEIIDGFGLDAEKFPPVEELAYRRHYTECLAEQQSEEHRARRKRVYELIENGRAGLSASGRMPSRLV